MKPSNKTIPSFQSKYRTDLILTPEAIHRASGIKINGRRYKSFLFSSDVATIMYSDADAVLAVYPYTPHPSIIQALNLVSPVPIAAGVGGAITQGTRSVYIARFADAYGCMGVVLNVAVDVETIKAVYEAIDLPIIYTVISDYQKLDEYLEAGVSILNISGGQRTAEIVRHYRKLYPDIPIIATGGREEDSIIATINAGANAISYTPPTTQAVFQEIMTHYREDLQEGHAENHQKISKKLME